MPPKKPNPSSSPKKSESLLPHVPRGYFLGEAEDGTDFIVPHYLIPDLQQCFAAHREKTIMKLTKAKTQVRHSSNS